MKVLEGKTESITYEEASDLKEKALDDFIFLLVTIVDSCDADEEEKSNMKVNLTNKLGNLMGVVELTGILMNEDIYISKIDPSGQTKIVEKEVM